MCKEQKKLYFQEYYKKHRQKLLEYAKNYQQENKKIIYKRSTKNQSKYQKARNAAEAKRRACKLQQTPKWADLKAIEHFYRNCPEGYHVDHIIPLQGKNVRGLHVLENLQYLPANANISKGNR
jgi:hypothetical protein